MGVRSKNFILKASKIGSKLATKDGPQGKPIKGRRYHIHGLHPKGDGQYVCLVKDAVTGQPMEIPEEFFDWAKPWHERGPMDPIDVDYRRAVKRDRQMEASSGGVYL